MERSLIAIDNESFRHGNRPHEFLSLTIILGFCFHNFASLVGSDNDLMAQNQFDKWEICDVKVILPYPGAPSMAHRWRVWYAH